MTTSLLIAQWCMILMLGCVSAQQEEVPQDQEAPPAVDTADDPVDAAEAPQPVAGDVDELLDRLERNADELTGFKATILYIKESALLGRKEIRRGTLIYQLDPDDDKQFALLFDRLQIGNRMERRSRNYVFDGRWLAEVDYENKQFIKREIVPPGEQLDPLKLGEGPFPLPVGQSKADVLARFDVSSVGLPDEGPLAALEGVQGIRLVPKPGSVEAEDFDRVDIFYDDRTLLPVGIDAIEPNGDRKVVRLSDALRNPKLDEADLARLSIAEPDATEWHVIVTPWGRDG